MELLLTAITKASDFLRLEWSTWSIMKIRRKRVSMLRPYRTIRFTEEEKRNAWNYIRLYVDHKDYGEFDGEFIIPEKRRIYGWWKPSYDATLDFADDGILIDKGNEYWAFISYITSDAEIETEQELIDKKSATAYDFMRLRWDTLEVCLPSTLND